MLEKEESKEEPGLQPSLRRTATYETEFIKNFGKDGFGRIAILLFGKLYPKNQLEQEYIYSLCVKIISEAFEA